LAERDGVLQPPHPRERTEFVGHEAAEAELVAALAGGRLPHAWLIGGPEGIGKATLAYRFARALLAGGSEGGSGSLAVDAGSRTARQVAARSHPNLVVLERLAAEGEKAPARFIPAASVRKALGFFGTTSADGGRRVAIVDSVEDLNLQGLNALLKTVEEPPAGAVILLVSHAPGRVLPTIRSRCRKLTLSRLAEHEVSEVIASLASADPPDPSAIRHAAVLADGSVGRALALLEPKRLSLVQELRTLLDELPRVRTDRILALAERLADKRQEGEFEIAIEAMLRWAADRVRATTSAPPARLAPLAEVCEKVAEAARSVETYNLDRRPLIVSAFGDLARAVRLAV
jgi:DNA polymerase-3 subunit delta'